MAEGTLPQEKTCSKCGETKPLGEFSPNARSKSGRQSRCKTCASRAAVERRKANPERTAEANRRYRERHGRDRQMEHRYLRRHNERHRRRYLARKALKQAVREGRIAKPNCCERCGETVESRALHGHHSDYSKPLEVEWLCRGCHANV